MKKFIILISMLTLMSIISCKQRPSGDALEQAGQEGKCFMTLVNNSGYNIRIWNGAVDGKDIFQIMDTATPSKEVPYIIGKGAGIPKLKIPAGTFVVNWFLCIDSKDKNTWLDIEASMELLAGKDYVAAFIADPPLYYTLSEDGNVSKPVDTPTNVLASDGTFSDRISITWDSADGADYYKVYRSESAGGDYTLVSPDDELLNYPSFDDTSMVEGKVYYYKVKGFNEEYESEFSDADSGIAGESLNPDPPGNISASDGEFSDHVTVSWASVDDADYYLVYRTTMESRDYELISPNDDSLTGTSYDDSLINEGQIYFYKVKAVNYYGQSDFSTSDSGFIGILLPPVSPVGLSATNGDYYDKVILTWNPVVNTEYYHVYRSEGINETFNLVSPGDSSVKIAEFVDTEVVSGTMYYYKVTAENSSGESSMSSYVYGFASMQLPPEVPGNVKASKDEYFDRILIQWDHVEDADYYKVFRSQSPNGTYELVSIDDNTLIDNEFEDLTADPGIFYYFKVKAYNEAGESEFSAYDYGLMAMPLVPAAPANVNATDGNPIAHVNITWEGVTDADYYKVFRSTSENGDYELISPDNESLVTLSFDDITVTEGVFYFYKVKAYNSYGGSEFSLYDEGYAGDDLLPPMAPENVSATDGDPIDEIIVTWDKSIGSTSYNVYRKDSVNQDFIVVANNLTELTYTDIEVSENIFYYYKITGINLEDDESEKSRGDQGYIGNYPVAPEATEITSVGRSGSNLIITWLASENASAYNLFRATESSGPYNQVQSNIDALNFTDTSLSSGNYYYYKISAVNTIGESPKSAFKWNYAGNQPGEVAIADNVTVMQVPGTTSLRISWSSVQNANIYRLYKSTLPDSDFNQVVELNGQTEYVDNGIGINTVYYYKVKACRRWTEEVGSGCNTSEETHTVCGDYSDVAVGYVGDELPIPNVPSTISASRGDFSDKIAVGWGTVPNADFYKLYKSSMIDGPFHKINIIYDTTFDDINVIENNLFYYKVAACNYFGCSEESVATTGFSGDGLIIPEAPLNVAASDGLESDHVVVSWDLSMGAEFYKVYRSDEPEGSYELVSPYDSSLVDTTFNDYSMTVGMYQYYRVKAFNVSGQSDFSEYDQGYAGALLFPDVPTDVEATNKVFEDRVVISWAPVTGADTYSLYKATNSTGPYTLLAEGLSGTSYDDTAVSPGMYYYKVKSVNIYGISDFSEMDSGYRAISAEEFYKKFQVEVEKSLTKISVFGGLGNETVNGIVSGTYNYDAHMKGLGAEIFNTYNNYSDFGMFYLTGRHTTTANMSGSGTLKGQINVTNIYAGYVRHDLIITNKVQSGGYYYIKQEGDSKETRLDLNGNYAP